MPISMKPVKSSQIREIGHDPVTNTLAVRFNTGSLYHYTGVDATKFSAFHATESIGSHFGKHIKGHHDYTRITETKEKE